ncbi:MAG: hypothetical protein PHU66_08400 [Bacteroidaceae bacterium]|nr:hypothetical protein [Bacteroidaceae bacterium]
MFKNFNEFNFEVVNVSIQGTPDFYVNLNGITFSKKMIEDMNYPAYIRPLVDAENKALAFQACKQSDDRAMKFSKPRGEQNGCISFQHNVLQRTARTVMKESWKDNSRYCMTAIYFPEAKAMVVDLTSATELPPLRPRKK